MLKRKLIDWKKEYINRIGKNLRRLTPGNISKKMNLKKK